MLPSGFFPDTFTDKGELILVGKHKVYMVDPSLKIIAKLSIKGDYCDYADEHILVTKGDSFYVYYHHPNAKVYIYRVGRKPVLRHEGRQGSEAGLL